MAKKAGKIYVVGHKNPDTDSICSAIAYANLKREITGNDYIAKRAGQINEETHYVLQKFGVKVPNLLEKCQITGKRYGYPPDRWCRTECIFERYMDEDEGE